MMYIYINLVSAQLFPNVIPTLSAKSGIAKVYLVQSGNSYRQSAEQLRDFYLENGIAEVEIFKTPDAIDYPSLRQGARDLYRQIKAQYPDAYIVLNATGGTKPMSLAFTMQFDNLAEGAMAIYTDTEKNQLIILNDDENLKSLPYASVLDIESYLKLSGFIAESWVEINSLYF